MRDSSLANDPVYDVLRVKSHPLSALFKARSVALIGASDRSGIVGLSIWSNLLKGGTEGGFAGTLYPVNPNRSSILGRATYRSVDIPEPVDLAVDRDVSSAPCCRRRSRNAPKAGIPMPCHSAAGFKEAGSAGQALEKEVLAEIEGRMRIIGPNCLGVMSPRLGLNATFAAGHRPARHRRLHQPERRPVHGHPRLEPQGQSASARSSRSARCSTSAGAT